MNHWHLSGQDLIKQIKETDTTKNEIAMWFLGQCGLAIKYGKTLLLVDPVLNDLTAHGSSLRLYTPPFAPDALQPNFVLCTHGHIDHMAEGTLEPIAKAFPETKYIIPSGCRQLAQGFGLEEKSLLLMQDGIDTLLTSEISVQAFSAAHPKHIDDPDSEEMALGYCVRFGDIAIAHLGDTYLTRRLLDSLHGLGQLSVLFSPINGDDLFRTERCCIGNIGAEEAALLAAELRPELTIPTHYDMIAGNTVDPMRFAAELRRLNPACGWKIPALGERIICKVDT